MKKISLILLATVAIFASCSKHNDAPIVAPEEAWLYDVNLPVPIQFSSTSSLTKAEVVPVDGKFPAGLSLGIFGVNNNGDYWYATAAGDYLWTDETTNKPYVAELLTRDGGALEFSTTQYYPIRSDKSYDFYGYYPYQNTNGEAATVSGTQGAAIKYNIGNIDVLWAKAEGKEYSPKDGSAAIKGFNAKYIRAITKDGKKDENLPNLAFKHKLAKITFHVTSGMDKDNSAISVTNVDITGNYNSATFIVASREHLVEGASPSDDKSGTFTEPKPGNIPLYSTTNDATSLNVYPKAWNMDAYKADPSPWSLGYAFILPTNVWPEDAQGKNLTADIHLAQKGSALPKLQSVKLPYPEEDYVEGYEYVYRIIVYDAQNVEVNVTLEKMSLYTGNFKDDPSTNTGSVADDNDFVLYE